VKSRPREALKWYRKAIDQGNVGAQNNLGLMYQFGHGVPRD
jgi:TPR repeat protein